MKGNMVQDLPFPNSWAAAEKNRNKLEGLSCFAVTKSRSQHSQCCPAILQVIKEVNAECKRLEDELKEARAQIDAVAAAAAPQWTPRSILLILQERDAMKQEIDLGKQKLEKLREETARFRAVEAERHNEIRDLEHEQVQGSGFRISDVSTNGTKRVPRLLRMQGAFLPGL